MKDLPIRRALVVAVTVGSILTLINQWEAVTGTAAFHPVKTTLTYLVPFCVFLAGALLAPPRKPIETADLETIESRIELLSNELDHPELQLLGEQLARWRQHNTQ